MGGKQNILEYEIEEEGRLILKVKLSSVNKNNDRQLEIHYSVNGKIDKTISTSTVEGLSANNSANGAILFSSLRKHI
ncbi:hypothetical protein SporoP8_15900 [Sporosarcina ureae]|uniref:hypothetical protein n=1 Tax=Sporosarcina ureae TaxID=1571 RepID=UPI000A1599B3|nr:hypothetical protein [Sporosarcina ureae]ARJ40240.1 hypothetical protein SporoP8_15900 [Sporosarcina ureae]